MARAAHAYAPSMSDAAVKAKTGKDWASWFAALDAAGAGQMEHKAIAQMLARDYGVPGWWSQNVTVEYERARGLRQRHETTSGYSVSASKTIGATLAAVYEACVDPAIRRKWFPRGVFTPTSQTRNKYLNGAWKKTARINIGLYAKGARKGQIAVGVSRLSDKAAVESERAAWRAALTKLQKLLES